MSSRLSCVEQALHLSHGAVASDPGFAAADIPTQDHPSLRNSVQGALMPNAPGRYAYNSKQTDDEPIEPSEGFWHEFFLHKPEPAGLKRVLASTAPDEMLHQQAHSQQLFRQAILRIKQAKAPADDIALEVRHAIRIQKPHALTA